MSESLILGAGKTEEKLTINTMPPNLDLTSQYSKVTISLKRKIEDEIGSSKKRAEEAAINTMPDCFSKSEYPIEFSPPREEDTLVPPGLTTTTDSKISFKNMKTEGCNGTMIEQICLSGDILTSTSVSFSCDQDQFGQIKRSSDLLIQQKTKRQCTDEDNLIVAKDSQTSGSLEDPLIIPIQTEENKENLVCLKTLTENQNFESILQKTLFSSRSETVVEGDICLQKADVASVEANTNAKVIVEHLPSSSYHHLCDDTSSLDEACTSLDEEDDDDDSEDESSMFDTPPPKTVYDRFWSNTSTNSSASSTSSSNTQSPTYQFLEQNNQRIECHENGKSYLQLGTVNHHHLPVTPVLQPKPTTLAPRRPSVSLCRPLLPPRPPNPTPPVCDHPSHLSPVRNCSASCYRQQRSEMLSLSLHKLHTARQRSDSSLRRSVLICNMLRYIEVESTTEQRHHAESIGYCNQDIGLEQSPYWNSTPVSNFTPPLTPNPYRENSNSSSTSGNNTASYSSQNSSSQSRTSSCGNFDAPLKDFNSAFRQSSPSSMMTSASSISCNIGPNSTEATSSSLAITSTSSTQISLDDERGINWSSVLSLTSQNELDPINNNSYSEQSSSAGWTSSSPSLSELNLSQTSFEDVSWKVANLPIVADDLMKTFPEENLFECAA